MRNAVYEREQLNTPMIVVAGVVAAVFVFVVIVALQAWFYNVEQAEVARKIVAATPQELAQVTAQHQGQINGYRYVDREKGIVAIPIDMAMEQVVRDGPAIATRPGSTTHEAR